MKIIIDTAVVKSVSEEYQEYSCGMRLCAENGEHKFSRLYGFWLSNNTYEDARMLSVILSLSSVASRFRDKDVTLRINDDFAIDVLYGDVVPSNADITNELKRWFSYYTRLKIVHCEYDPMPDEIFEIANRSISDKTDCISD